MAEENVVIPRDRYNRMLEQLKNSKDDKLTQQVDNTTDIKPVDLATPAPDNDKVVHTVRTKDDIVLKESHHPPGLKHNDIDIFMKRIAKQKSRKNTKLTTHAKHKTRKSKLKANWISISK